MSAPEPSNGGDKDAFSTASLSVSITATAVFTIFGFYHVYLFVRHRTWFFWLIIVAIFLETSAFGVRAYFDSRPNEQKKFLISYLLVNLSPSILSAGLMYTFSRLTWYTTPSFQRKFSTTWLPTGILKKLFKLTFLGSFLVLLLGAGGLVTSSPEDQQLPHQLLKAGFIIQTTLTFLFTITTLHYMLISRKWTDPSTHAVLTHTTPTAPWRHLGWTIFTSSLLLTFRTIYRTIECSTGSPSTVHAFLQKHEYLFWPLDTIPVLLVFCLLAVFHPGSSLPREYSVFWFRTAKVRKLEAKMVGSQVWPDNGWICAADQAGGVELQNRRDPLDKVDGQRVYVLEAIVQGSSGGGGGGSVLVANGVRVESASGRESGVAVVGNSPGSGRSTRVSIHENRSGSGLDLPLRKYQDEHLASLSQGRGQ